MKTSFKLLLTLSSLALLSAPVVRAEDPASPPAADQSGRRHGGGAGAMMEKAAKELGLTADQEAKWKEIGQAEKTAFAAIHGDTGLSREDRRAKMMETNKTFAEQRRALLNPEQQKKFDEMRARLRERAAKKDLPAN
jgi:Spy/CpxP family protein refolding chaperone